MVCNTPFRIVLIVLNTFSWLFGLAMVTIGIIMILGKDVIAKILDGFITPLIKHISSTKDVGQVNALMSKILAGISPVGITIFSFGAALAIFSFIGYTGACCKYKVLLYVYAAIVGVIALAVLIIVVVYFKFSDKLADRSVALFEASVKKYTSLEANTVDSLVVGFVQLNLKCCGVDSAADFTNLSSNDVYDDHVFNDVKLAVACCAVNQNYILSDENCPGSPTEKNSYMNIPCRQLLKNRFIHYMNFAAYGLIAVFVLLLLVALFTVLTVAIEVV